MICESCGNPVSADAIFCPMCGSALKKTAESEAVQSKSEKKVMKRAPFVGFTFLLFAFFLFSMVVTQTALLFPEKFTGVFAQGFLETVDFLPPVLSLLYCYFCVRRRCIDIGKSPYYSLLMLIPLFGFIYVIYLCFKKSVPLTS